MFWNFAQRFSGFKKLDICPTMLLGKCPPKVVEVLICPTASLGKCLLGKCLSGKCLRDCFAIMGRIYIQMLDIWYWYISIWNTGYVDISTNGSGSRIFLLHKISFLATGYWIWIYIHLKSMDLDMIWYPKKLDMTHSCFEH